MLKLSDVGEGGTLSVFGETEQEVTGRADVDGGAEVMMDGRVASVDLMVCFV